ncbi:MAG: hypothetical protein ACL93V_12495 [Candidatus Electrothrix sp. YB6]
MNSFSNVADANILFCRMGDFDEMFFEDDQPIHFLDKADAAP